jgi:hypothetical protein
MLFNNESLNCDGHQFHQYQHNEPLILAELSEHKKITTYDAWNPDPGLGQAQTCGRVKPVNGIPLMLKMFRWLF